MLKLGSLFDGIGGWPLAAIKFGINPVWSSEIAPFPQEITKTHFPSMKHLGDITKINGAEIDPVDIICMGSPCQDLSIAGKREGLDGERSGLFRRAVDIVRQMRNATNGQYPRFIVWENVPGAFSSNKRNDFRTVLEEITETEIPMPTSGRWATAGMVRSNKCEVAWRVLDAQFWGVPQRRKRIFLVADFGGKCATEILFKPESMSGDFAEGCGEGQRIAGITQNSPGAAVVAIDHAITTGGNCTAQGPCVKENGPMRTLKASGAHAVCTPAGTGIAYSFDSLSSNSMKSKNPHSGCRSVEVAKCLDTAYPDPSKNQGGIGVLQPVTFSVGNLVRGADAAVSYALHPRVTGTICASGAGTNRPAGQGNETELCIVQNDYKARRLMPKECERLQGLPDGYTLIDDKKCSDSARYKALGNGMAQPCPDFVMEGIARVFRRDNHEVTE